MTSQFADMTSSSNFFDGILFFLTSLVTDPSFTGSGVMTIFFYKEITQKYPRMGFAYFFFYQNFLHRH